MRKKMGFTLIELVVVVGIIAMLSLVGVISYTRAAKNSRDAKRKADLENLKQALVLYKSDNGTYPATAALDLTTMAPIQNYVQFTSLSDPKPSPYPQYVYTSPVSGTQAGTTFQACATLEAGTPSTYCVYNP